MKKNILKISYQQNYSSLIILKEKIRKIKKRLKTLLISILKAKEKKLIKQFVLSSSRKKLNKNFVQNDGFTTEIKSIKDILNKQKKIEEKTSHLNIKEEKDYLQSVLLYYNRNDFKYNNSISMKERIKLNIDKLMKNRNYEHIFSILEKKA